MNKEKTIQNPTEDSEQSTDFHGAALIDEDGNEIPITEDMVQDACHNLEENELEEDDNLENNKDSHPKQ